MNTWGISSTSKVFASCEQQAAAHCLRIGVRVGLMMAFVCSLLGCAASGGSGSTCAKVAATPATVNQLTPDKVSIVSTFVPHVLLYASETTKNFFEGDKFVGFAGQSRAVPAARLDDALEKFKEAGLKLPGQPSFHAPTESYDQTTEALIKQRGPEDATQEGDVDDGLKSFDAEPNLAMQMRGLSVIRMLSQGLLSAENLQEITNEFKKTQSKIWRATARDLITKKLDAFSVKIELPISAPGNYRWRLSFDTAQANNY